jgi:hypothetical protein
MMLHRIPCETFSLAECQMAIAHHIVTGLSANSPVQGVISLPSDACRRVAGSVVEGKELAVPSLQCLSAPYLREIYDHLFDSNMCKSWIELHRA